MFDMSKVMNSDDAVSANFAEVFVTLNDRRYSMLMCKKFEGKAGVENHEVNRLGTLIKGHKPGLVELSFTMTIYKCTEIIDDVIETYLKTGVMPRFEIQTSNEDPATSSTLGRSTKVYNGCTLDGDVLLSLADAEGGFIEQEISGFAESYTRPEKFNNPSYM
ncbi:MAG: hypothetical protein IKN72_03690 [Clostridia bacterium]|nr:hypothetical protein [Clostridia bacterium]